MLGATHVRRVDILINQVAHECKSGYVAYSAKTLTQIRKDAWLLRYAKEINRVEWHFFRSAETGRIGADPRLLRALDDNGIPYVIHQ